MIELLLEEVPIILDYQQGETEKRIDELLKEIRLEIVLPRRCSVMSNYNIENKFPNNLGYYFSAKNPHQDIKLEVYYQRWAHISREVLLETAFQELSEDAFTYQNLVFYFEFHENKFPVNNGSVNIEAYGLDPVLVSLYLDNKRNKKIRDDLVEKHLGKYDILEFHKDSMSEVTEFTLPFIEVCETIVYTIKSKINVQD